MIDNPNTITNPWKRIVERWQALGALAGSFAAGALLVLVLGGFVGLPAQHESDMAEMSERVTKLEHAIQDLHTITCLLTADHLDTPSTDCVD